MTFYFTIEEPVLLWLLFAVPLLLFSHLYFMRHARKKAILFGNFKTLERITGKRLLTKNLVLLLLRMIVIASLVLAVAGVTLWKTGERGPNEVVFVVDSSASMSTMDMGGSRIDAARSIVKQSIDRFTTTNAIGIIQYSGLPEVLIVPTEDRSAVKKAADAIQLKPVGGSDIASAIVTATNLLSNSPNGRVIVLLTDGVASLSLYEDNPIPQAVSYARRNAVVIHTIGVGSERIGSIVPGLEAQAIIFDEQNLQLIANSTGGEYFWAKDTTQLESAFSKIATEGATGFVPVKLSFALVLVALIAVLVEWGLLNTRFRLIP